MSVSPRVKLRFHQPIDYKIGDGKYQVYLELVHNCCGHPVRSFKYYCLRIQMFMIHRYSSSYTKKSRHSMITLHHLIPVNDVLFLTPEDSAKRLLHMSPFGRYLDHVFQDAPIELVDEIQSWALTRQLAESRCFYCSRLLDNSGSCSCDMFTFLVGIQQGRSMFRRDSLRNSTLINQVLYISLLELVRAGVWKHLTHNLIISELTHVGLSLCVLLDANDYRDVSTAVKNALLTLPVTPDQPVPFATVGMDVVVVKHGDKLVIFPLRSIVGCIRERQALKHSVFESLNIGYKIKRRAVGHRRRYNSIDYYHSDYSEDSESEHVGAHQPRFPLVIPTYLLNGRSRNKLEEAAFQEYTRCKKSSPFTLEEVCKHNLLLECFRSEAFLEKCKHSLPTSLYENYISGAVLVRKYALSDYLQRILDILLRPVEVLVSVKERAVEMFSVPSKQ